MHPNDIRRAEQQAARAGAYWKDKPVADMTREEMLEAFFELEELYRSALHRRRRSLEYK